MFDHARRSIDPEFGIFLDEARSIPTAYNRDNGYLGSHFRRMHRSYGAISPYVAKGARILDIGGSPFYLPYLLSKYDGAETDVIFYARDAHQLSHSSVAYYPGGSLNLIFKNIEDNSPGAHFSDEQYDVILSTECIEHLDYFPFRFFEFVKSHLKVGGMLYITTPNACDALKNAQLLLGRNIFHPYRPDSSGRHKYEYTLGGLVNVVEDCLDLETISARRFLPSVRRAKSLFYMAATLGGLVSSRLPFIEVLAKKTEEGDSVNWDAISGEVYRETKSLEL